jgi:hypothetical protein
MGGGVTGLPCLVDTTTIAVSRAGSTWRRLIAGETAFLADEPAGLDEPEPAAPLARPVVSACKHEGDRVVLGLCPDRRLEQFTSGHGARPDVQVGERGDHAPGRPPA